MQQILNSNVIETTNYPECYPFLLCYPNGEGLRHLSIHAWRKVRIVAHAKADAVQLNVDHDLRQSQSSYAFSRSNSFFCSSEKVRVGGDGRIHRYIRDARSPVILFVRNTGVRGIMQSMARPTRYAIRSRSLYFPNPPTTLMLLLTSLEVHFCRHLRLSH